jgi:hypothetical protein
VGGERKRKGEKELIKNGKRRLFIMMVLETL